jgi:putative chitinase
LNYFADKDDFITITRRINGGLNGLEDREAYWEKAKLALAVA